MDELNQFIPATHSNSFDIGNQSTSQLNANNVNYPNSEVTGAPPSNRVAPILEPQQVFQNLRWLTAREAVVYLRLPSLGALRNLVYRRKIPFSKLGRNLRFDRQGLDRFLESSLTKRRIL